jgi:hypothetical protein
VSGPRRLLVAAAASAIVAVSGPALGQGGTNVRLPTGRDAIALVPGADDILLGAGFEERQFPGRVADVEIVHVDLDTDGAVAAVQVTQRLTLSGLGDFSFRIPGPVANLEPLPEAQSVPGLRRGSVIWQGFSPGERVLGARMDLYPEVEAAHLPLRIELSLTVGGAPPRPETLASGPFELRIRIENTTPIATRVTEADADPAAAAEALDAIAARLREGDRPVPGRRGIPKAIPATGQAGTRTVQIEAPFEVRGDVDFPPGTISGLAVQGGRLKGTGSGVAFGRRLGGGGSLAAEVRVTGTARNLSLPGLVLTAWPAPPAASTVAPPDGAATWTGAVEAGVAPDGRVMLAAAMDAMWRTARLRVFDAYLGSPDPNGPVSTTYSFALNPPRAAVIVPPPAPKALGGFGIALAAAAGLALLFAVGLLWAHA